jgi:RimJ/RimL family protein N-acetyltransferase
MDARSYAVSETLKDGTAVTVRAIRPGDAGALLEAFKSLDRESVYRRFFSPKKELTEAELTQLSDVDFSRVVALLVAKQTGEHEVLMGGGRYASSGPGSDQAEIAFMTAGDYRGLGIASLILTHLRQIAREAGVERFEAEVLAENEPMLAVFRRSGLPVNIVRDGSTLHVTLSLGSRKEQRHGT